ncbi:hypothetical protein DL95DRAFT_129276 [Leptodontidium sp. 2 PMI_412]|nr:hypothetical protein DL95DRAFT_129276 [Leptodontidium sp. 2 PMI_412]
MRSMCLKRDPNAPCFPSEEDKQDFEKRRDVSSLRERLAQAKISNPNRNSWRPLFMQVGGLIHRLSDLKVRAKRVEYFERVDHLRALGQSTIPSAAINTPFSARALQLGCCSACIYWGISASAGSTKHQQSRVSYLKSTLFGTSLERESL